jgi:CelD/BcsL family acetyltransferase involved in cellulose biosynthesis
MNMHSPIRAAVAERLEIVSSTERLAEIADAWTALWRDSDVLIFQSHAWVSAWWTTIADRDHRALRIGLVWHGERLVAVAPLAVARRRGVRLLEWTAASYTDYGDILVARDCPPDSLTRLWREIRKAGGYDIVAMNRLLPNAAARTMIATSAEAGLGLKLNHRSEPSFRVAPPWTTGTAWLESQNKKMRQNYRRGYKALEESGGPAKFRLLGDDEPLAPVLARTAELKRKWLVRQGHESALFDDGATTLPALVDALKQAGILRVFVIECAGQMVAVSLNFVQRDTMMAFVTTYDPEFDRASPGMLLMVDYVRWSIDNGLKLVDFLCGDEPFKLRFANTSVTLETFMGTRTLLGTAATLADDVRYRIQQRRQMATAAATEEPVPAEA